MIKPEIDLELSIAALEVYPIEPAIIRSMLSNLQKVVKQNCNLQNVSVSLLHKKAIEYAKIIHRDEFDDPCFAPDVEQTIRDFKSGFEAAIKYSNER